jgi:hypothetical protein
MGKWNWYCPECDFRSGKSRHIDNHKRLHYRKNQFYDVIYKIPSIDYIPEFNQKDKLIICMIEFRIMDSIKHVINSVLRIYKPDEIGLCIVHGNFNKKFIYENFGNWKNIKLVQYNFNNIGQKIYSKILKTPQFWENFSNWDSVLIIQTDALMLRRIDDIYFNFDYIGSPWDNNKCENGGNGGFSLRKVKTMINCTEENRNNNLNNISGSNEDIFFANKKLNITKDYQLHKSFAVEKIFNNNPVGYHAIYKEITFTDEQYNFLIDNIKSKLY